MLIVVFTFFVKHLEEIFYCLSLKGTLCNNAPSNKEAFIEAT
jgi:hypothetical protein